jgi:hypothetical protein
VKPNKVWFSESSKTCPTPRALDPGEKKVEIGMPVEMVTRRIRSDGDERGMLVYW